MTIWVVVLFVALGAALFAVTRSLSRLASFVGTAVILTGGLWLMMNVPENLLTPIAIGVFAVFVAWVVLGPEGYRSGRRA